jgi:hypothetical protein
MYASIGAGVNFLVNLILYLVDANKVVPKTVEPKLINESDVNKLKSVIDETRQKEEEQKAQKELEQQKILEEQRLLDEQNIAEGQDVVEENSEQENNSSEIYTDNSQIENISTKEGE